MTDFTKLSPEDLARVTTRDGRKAEIITTKGRGAWPIAGYIGESCDLHVWHGNGAFIWTGHPADLILPPAPRVYYANGYAGAIRGHHKSAEAARTNRSPDWLALYRITDDGVSDTLPCEVIERNKEA